MRLSTRARYALRMMIEVARESDGEPVSLGQVADSTHISRRYLDQLAIGLKNASLIRGRSGRGGGYRLTRAAEQVTVGQIIEAAIGPINIVECVRQPETCLMSDTCQCRWVYTAINQRITEVLNEISLADLADENECASLAATISTQTSACPAR